MDDVEAHKISPPPDTQACDGALGAGILLSKQASSRGTVGAETYADRTCTPPTTYNSVDEVLAADKAQIAAGKEPIKSFALPANANKTDQEQQVQNAIYGLEEQAGHKLNYCWFNDDSGKTQVFLLGSAEKPSDGSGTKAATSCTPFDQLIDDSLNLTSNIPLGTPQGESMKIINQRTDQAHLAKAGIPIDASKTEVDQIMADREARIQALQDRLPAEEFRTDADRQAFDQSKSAIEVGLQENATADEISQAKAANDLAAKAIKIGLDPRSTKDDVDAVYKRIDQTPDAQLNAEYGLPASTTRADALDQTMQWLNNGELIMKGYDPSMSADQRRQESQSRYAQEQPFQNLLNSGNLTPEQEAATRLSIEAIEIGLPADTSKDRVEATKAQDAQQGMAVTLGLDRYSSAQAIKDAQERSDGDLPGQMCQDK